MKHVLVLVAILTTVALAATGTVVLLRNFVVSASGQETKEPRPTPPPKDSSTRPKPGSDGIKEPDPGTKGTKGK
jgi:hypothetical protein